MKLTWLEVTLTVALVVLMVLVMVNEVHPFIPQWEPEPQVEETKAVAPDAKAARAYDTPPPLEAGMARFGYDTTAANSEPVDGLHLYANRYPFPSGSPTHLYEASVAVGAVPASATFAPAAVDKQLAIYCSYDIETLVPESIYAQVVDTGGCVYGGNLPWKAAIYDAAGNRVALSSAVTIAGVTNDWFEFPVAGAAPLATGQSYLLTANVVDGNLHDHTGLGATAFGEYEPPSTAVWDPSPTYSASSHVYYDTDGDGEYELYHASCTVAPGVTPPGGCWERKGGSSIMGEATPGAFLGRVRMGRESATQYGDQTTVTTYIWPCMSQISGNSNKNPVETNCKTGERGVRDLHSTRVTQDGRMRFEVGPENIHKLLYWAHGAHAVAATLGVTAGALEHNVASGTAQTPYSFSAWVDHGEQDRSGATMVTLYPGMFITGYDMTIGDRSLLTLDTNYIGKEQQLVSPTVAFSPSLSTLQPFVSKEHLTVELGGRSLSAQFVNGSIRYDPTITGRENAGSRNIQGGYAGRGRAMVDFTLDFDDVASVKEYLDGSPTTSPTLPVAMTFPDQEAVLELVWAQDETCYGTNDPYELRCRAPRYQFTAMVRELPEDSDSPIRVDFRGQALQSFAATSVALRGDLIWRFYNRLAATAFTS